MIIKENEPLKDYTTVKIGGTASRFYIPESVQELTDLLKELEGEEFWLLGGGSNILMDDTKTFPNVIYLLKCNDQLEQRGEGEFYAGCSLRLQKFITTINNLGYGGIEYLFSVPGTLGGAILMNAGRGKERGVSISDYILSVDVYRDGEIKTIKKEECEFSYRNSIFKGSNMIILGATFRFPKDDPKVFEKKRQERMEYVREHQDYSGTNFGSVFCKSNKIAMAFIKLLHPGYKKGIRFSGKTNNWILNKGEGTYAQAMKVIRKAKTINRLLGTEAELEVILWN